MRSHALPRFTFLVCATLFGGCGPSPGGDDAGIVRADAGRDGDAGARVDAGTQADSGAPSDAGHTSGADPSMAGPFTVTRSSTEVGEATAEAFVPSVSGALAPLILFKHGFQLSTDNYDVLAERLASHGFVVVGVDTAGGIFGGPTNADERDATIAVLDWALGAAPFAAQVDADRVAVMGHSRGGKVGVLVAAADARIDAALLLDPVNGCGPGQPFSDSCPDASTARYAGALSIPVGVMGETNNGSGGFMPCAPLAENYAVIFDGVTASPWAVEWTFEGADHMDFTDDGGGGTGALCPDGPGDDETIRAQVRTLAVAFASRHLRGDTSMDAWLVGASVPADVTRRGP